MNFGLATEQLRSEDIDARFLVVTDDIASAPADDITKRRGIAGDFTVFRCASAAAEEGATLDDVERVALKTNDATRTLGVAFDGCTLPGADRPLFTVAQGTMGLGLGIHGEPGVSSHDMPTAADLAALLVDGVLAETALWCNGSRRGRPQWAGPNHVRGTVRRLEDGGGTTRRGRTHGSATRSW